MKIAKGIWISIIILLLIIVASIVWFMTTDYELIISFAIEQLQRPDLKNTLTQKYFTPEKFITLQRAGYSAFPILLALIGLLIVKRKTIIKGFTSALQKIYNLCKSVYRTTQESSKSIKLLLVILLALILVRSIYYALHFYPQYDECWNYNYFLSNHFLTTFFAYNNYPLHNIIAFIYLKLLPESTFVMRLPNIILGLINILLVFALSSKLFKNKKLALATAAIFAVLPTSVFYMLFARGVMLALFFTLIILYYFFIKKVENWSKVDRLLISMFGAFGCFSMISFPLFLFSIFLVFGLHAFVNKKIQNIKKIVWATLGITVFALILFFPMILGTGLSLATSSNYRINVIDWSAYISKAEFLSRNQIGFYYGAYLFIALNILMFYLSKRKALVLLNIILLLTPFLLPLLLKTYLPARALAFQVFAYLFTLTIILELLLNKKRSFLVFGIVLIVGLNYMSTSHTFFDWSARPDKGAYEIAQLLSNKNITSYYDIDGTFSYFVPSILYHYKIKDRSIDFRTGNKKSTRYIPLKKYNGDCYVVSSIHYQEEPGDEIIYEYRDEDKAFTLFRRSQYLQDEVHEIQQPP